MFAGFEKRRIRANAIEIALVQGGALPCGHCVPEEAPEQLLAELLEFLPH
jgi:pimeloyl-ACP methyl ester carboxylesterase